VVALRWNGFLFPADYADWCADFADVL